VHRAWDRRLALRAASIAVLTASVALLVVVATDDGAPWRRRLAMIAALAPIAGAVGAFAARGVAEARGELRALEALGVSPLRGALGATVGGTLIALVGPALLALPHADLAALLPRPPMPRVWVVESAHAMRELTLGLRIAAGGVLERTAQSALPDAVVTSRAAVVVAMLLLAIGAPTWASTPAPARRRAGVGAAALVVAIASFQAVAAGRLSQAALALAPALLLVDVALARYLGRARGTRSVPRREGARS
jgi:hypothetical protein